MKLVFWGEEHQCGTTAHMLAVMGMLSSFYPGERIRADRPGRMGGDGFRFCDCGAELTVQRRRTMYAADLVVVSLRQEKECMERFFSEHYHISERLFFLLRADARTVGANERYLRNVYRVEPEQMGMIPYNNEFYCAMHHNRGIAFIRRESASPTNFENEQFIQALRAVTARMLRLAQSSIK